jgi:hypothetical protein
MLIVKAVAKQSGYYITLCSAATRRSLFLSQRDSFSAQPLAEYCFDKWKIVSLANASLIDVDHPFIYACIIHEHRHAQSSKLICGLIYMGTFYLSINSEK